MTYPQWTVLHIPHYSTEVPAAERGSLVLSDEQLAAELLRMTDHYTSDLFSSSTAVAVRSPVSRLIVDVERFSDDALEPMAARGMGAVYLRTSHHDVLRRDLAAIERQRLMTTYYVPHHLRLERAVADALTIYGCCTVIDCHSFPSRALPYEQAKSSSRRSDICIGTDAFHTPTRLASSLCSSFQNAGFSVSVNDPFAGALVPVAFYQSDKRVSAFMVEVNRDLYMDESTGNKHASFQEVARRIRRCISGALA